MPLQEAAYQSRHSNRAASRRGHLRGSVAIASLVVALSSCNNDRIARVESEIQNLKQEVAQIRKANALELQAKCASDAKAWFRDNWSRDRETMLLDYSAHYNSVANKCFIEVYYNWSISVGSTTALHKSASIHNVYENQEYGHIYQESKIGEFSEPQKVGDCIVYGTRCKTEDEYRSLANKLMAQ